ncbi:hypothetical protein [Sedimenticola hydrogenitrophicus]|uniref:hypothetical protein n=1 Tax=Sedimenticola hydrogenitrophicus TaxID=2967975 RepID=UPI0021A775F2|nr:hypothetical protein [Sedimenticola hydrogenitrophicus]
MEKKEAAPEPSKWPYETVEMITGKYKKRIQSSIFYWSSLISFSVGVYLIVNDKMIGAFFAITLAPFLLLYPLVRFLFGGKDSVGVVVATAIAEEVIKHKVFKAIDESSKRKR